MPSDRSESQGDAVASLPPEVQAFLDEVVQHSLMRYDVLRFFHQNPYAILTISDLTVWMSLEERPLAEALQQLAALGYLSQSHASSAFVLASDRVRRQRLDEFFGYLDEHPELARRIRIALRGKVQPEEGGG